MGNLVNSVASGALSEAGTVISGSAGQILIFFIAISLIASALGVIAFIKGKK